MNLKNLRSTASLNLFGHAEKIYDVVVVGGGVSGSMAAIASARLGASTLLVEEHGFLGGSLTSMGVGPMMSFHNGAGRQLIGGLPQELVDRLKRRGASPGHIPDTTTYCSTVTPFDSEALKMELEAMMEETGAVLLYHTQLAGAIVEHGEIAAIYVCNKAGLSEIRAKAFVDATGDGDLAARAGVDFIKGRSIDGAAQPMTMNLKVGGVDVVALKKYVRENPDDFLWENGRDVGLARLETAPRVSLSGFIRSWLGAKERGEIDVPRDQVLFFETATPGTFIVNTSRIQGLDATDPLQLSRAETIGRRQCAQIFDFLKHHCAGFANAYRMDTAAKVGVRESRHVKGIYVLESDDLLTERQFPDAIAMGGYPIDIHSPDDAKTRTTKLPKSLAYQIPLRSLIVANPENLVVVGRCLSATHEASAAVRVTPISMAVGQAGGIVAALCARNGTAASAISPSVVRTILSEQKAILI